MSARPARTLLLAGALALVPAGGSGPARAAGTPGVSMPAALANGSRATGFMQGAAFPLRAAVGPSPARLGQPLTYRAHVIVTDGARASFGPPASGGNFTWGAPRAGRVSLPALPAGVSGWHADSVWLELPLQVFATGAVSIPGPVVTITPPGAGHAIRSRFPTVHLLVLPVLTAADSNATLRPVHGPLGAPWWERIPWRLVAPVMLALVAAVWFVFWLRRRGRRPAVTAAPARRPAVVRDPTAEALAALAKLRAERLAEQERFGEHALGLTRILRRFLEATLTTPRPGDTSGELVARVRSAGLAADDVLRLEGLLGLWDRVKFARAPLSLPEALRCESAVEQLVRRRESPREVA